MGMLGLTRRVGEEIWIAEKICIKILSIGGGSVTLGISAPRDLNIRRGELALEPNKMPKIGISIDGLKYMFRILRACADRVLLNQEAICSPSSSPSKP